jgi:DNA-binding beta-propeller fold protein YncE
MQNDGKIQRKLIFLIVLNIIVLVSVVVLSNLTYAQGQLGPHITVGKELHQKTLYEITKHTSSTQGAHITVGKEPVAIGVDYLIHRLYVANYGDGTVSVIDANNNSKR